MKIDEQNINPNFHQLFKGQFGFSADEFKSFLSCFSPHHLKKKEFFLKAGEVCKSKGYLNRGCTRNFVIDDLGHERILFFAFEDWWLGDFDSFYSGNPGSNNIQALEDCEILVISKEDFHQMESEIPKLKEWYSFKMQRSASATLKRFEEVKTLTAQERYQNLLEKHPNIFQRVPLQYIASFLNIEPQSLSRLRKRLMENPE